MADDWPFVSIIVPVYNGSRTIDALLSSLLELDYPANRHEILIVDNKSTDGTRERVQRYPVTLLEETEIQGSDAARNRGVEAAKGEILAFTDADCVVEPTWLKRLLANHEELHWGGFSGSTRAYPSSNLIARYCAHAKVLDLSLQQKSLFQPDGMGERLCSRISVLDYRSHISSPTGLFNPPTTNVAYRRVVFEKIGYFDQKMLPTGGDFDLAWRLQTQTDWQIAIVPDAVVYHQHRENLAGFTSMYRSYGGGYAILALKYSSDSERTARQLMVGGLVIMALTIPAHLLKVLMLPVKAIGRCPDALFWSEPILGLMASFYYNYGKADVAQRWLIGESLNATLQSTCKRK
ncbi:MAG: glycosyltransferase [Anaerolineales bacterium]|nr:MAG: glycosyltransferase [Anaerolineales bacterium]